MSDSQSRPSSSPLILSLQEFLLKILCVFRNLMKLSIFPRDWNIMRLLTSKYDTHTHTHFYIDFMKKHQCLHALRSVD